MVPASLSNAAVQINVMLNTNFCVQHFPIPIRGLDGPVSWLSYAFRFMQLPLGLLRSSLRRQLCPLLRVAQQRGQMDEFRRTLSNSLGNGISVDLTLVNWDWRCWGNPSSGRFIRAGRFRLCDRSRPLYGALLLCDRAWLGYAALKVLSPAFYLLRLPRCARTPVLVSLGSIALVNYGGRVDHDSSFAGLGHAGLARAFHVGGRAIRISWLLFCVLAEARSAVICWAGR